MNSKARVITLTAMFCALAFALTALVRIPVVLFLKYDPKDIVIALSGFIMGPVTAAIVAGITSVIEMLSISDTGIIGCVMNIVSSCSFACTAAFIYKKKRTLLGAGLGLIAGCVTMTAVMLIWNYCISPLYMGYPREAVAALLLPAFLPFNAIKSCLNAAFVFLLYKPVVGTLRKTRLLPQTEAGNAKVNVPFLCVAAAVIITCVLLILSLRGIL